MQWERLAMIPAVVALNVIASPRKSIPLRSTAWPLPPAEPTERCGRASALMGRAFGRKAKGSLPVRRWPFWAWGVNRDGKGEWCADDGGRGSVCLGVEGAVLRAGAPSSGMSSMDSKLCEMPLVMFSEAVPAWRYRRERERERERGMNYTKGSVDTIFKAKRSTLYKSKYIPSYKAMVLRR